MGSGAERVTSSRLMYGPGTDSQLLWFITTLLTTPGSKTTDLNVKRRSPPDPQVLSGSIRRENYNLQLDGRRLLRCYKPEDPLWGHWSLKGQTLKDVHNHWDMTPTAQDNRGPKSRLNGLMVSPIHSHFSLIRFSRLVGTPPVVRPPTIVHPAAGGRTPLDGALF